MFGHDGRCPKTFPVFSPHVLSEMVFNSSSGSFLQSALLSTETPPPSCFAIILNNNIIMIFLLTLCHVRLVYIWYWVASQV